MNQQEKTEPKLLPRDKLLRDTFTPAEAQLCAVIILTTTVTFWLADPRSYWGLGFLMIIGGICPFILKTHERTHPFFIDTLWPKFWLYSSPIWSFLLLFAVGMLQNPLQPMTIGEVDYLTIQPVNKWLPVSTTSSTTWVTVLSYCAMYLITLNLYLIPKSRAFFEKLLPWLCFSAVLTGIFGYIQKTLNFQNPLFTKGTGASDFFSFFPYDGHWAAFAIIWCGVCTSMTLLSARYDDSPDFIESTGPWYLTGAVLLGGSGFVIEARWPAVTLLICLSIMLLLVAAHFVKQSKDPHRSAIAALCGLLASIAFATSIFRCFQSDPHTESAKALHQAALDMFQSSPIFGWGMDSFAQLAPFYLDDTLLGARYDRAASDVLQLFAEVGIVGTVVPVVILGILMFQYVISKWDVLLTNHLLIGCAGVAVLAFLDTPFMSPAVFISFFTIIFSALRWAVLSRSKVDEVDAVARPTLVSPEAERNVPFFTDEYKETEK
ncbi:MAG: O-antigen ligase family protein [Opitutales bacterium]|jgi:hypothetical protein|nr:O-antigen ligase family protein [Opitutales bacterium]MDP4644750.1 O-antigen ligase family protein [Opitutales bacterium]MDP4777972.1 O-antigen ligase family protein [Opitutales bacterium]MDP4882966.1 O-antigen ligase family protein [Opitutales bacterium]MDP5080272.1 O-antigen ligase family protein [Opitutales bacterium]